MDGGIGTVKVHVAIHGKVSVPRSDYVLHP